MGGNLQDRRNVRKLEAEELKGADALIILSEPDDHTAPQRLSEPAAASIDPSQKGWGGNEALRARTGALVSILLPVDSSQSWNGLGCQGATLPSPRPPPPQSLLLTGAPTPADELAWLSQNHLV